MYIFSQRLRDKKTISSSKDLSRALEVFPDQVMGLGRGIFGVFLPARKSPGRQTQNNSNSSSHESILIASYVF